MSDAEEVAILIHRTEQLGFNIVDLYVPDDEVIAFTCSKSMDYIEAIQKVDVLLYRAKPKEGVDKPRGNVAGGSK